MIGIGVNLAAGLPDSTTPGWNVVDAVLARARAAAAAGLRTAWLPQTYGFDTLTLFAAVAREVGGIELGASVVVVQPRHPRVLAAQAQTVQAAAHGRLTLGLGVSHPGLLEVYGIPFERPVAALREHLDVLAPLLRGERAPGAAGAGSSPAETAVPGAAPPVPVLLGALGPVMLRLAGERAGGTITFLAGPRTIGEHVLPLLSAAAAGRPAPRVVAGVPVSLTADPDRVRAEVAAQYAGYAALPTYARTLQRDGVASPGELVVAGDVAAIDAGLRRYADAGATDLLVSPVGDAAERARTLDVLGALARA
ncbi:TIGR03564 family F420-dependent LLM class oxidoreductase [Pseudonocardia sp. NPDC046786]|uniref:TIGR03564 family F420-dependent LLM class oxidoreductase n=1 Tax=Pseudonocardia sp. NPDC046786 TaxID=3155471 RepID=UPI0033D890A0